MISIFMSSRPCVQILYFASLAFLANCIYNFIFYFFFCGNLFCLKKMTVCVLRVFLAIFLSLLTYFFSCSVSQSLRVSLSSFHFFFQFISADSSIIFVRIEPKNIYLQLLFSKQFCPHVYNFRFIFFGNMFRLFPTKSIRSISNLTLRACKLHTPTS